MALLMHRTNNAGGRAKHSRSADLPGELARLRRLCDCTRAVALLGEQPLARWLDAAAAQLADALAEQTGLAVLLGQWDQVRRGWAVKAAAVYGFDADSPALQDRVLCGSWPEDEFSTAAGHTLYPPRCGIGRLPELVPTPVWQRCSYRRVRERAQLGGGARWVGATSRRPTREALLIQIEDLQNTEGPANETLEDLAVLAPQVQAAYEASLLIPHLEREDGLRRLTPMQRSVVRLLLQGKTQREIAQSLERTYDTVHGHVKAIYDVLKLHSRDQLVQCFGNHRWESTDEA